MAKFKIYSKDGQTVRYEGCPRYNGTYLKVSYLEFSSIASPMPIAWQVGDYVDYPRTGLRYTLRDIPAVKKTAKPGQTGDAFVYQNVRFMAQTQDLAVAPFIDLVPEDNGVHFSTQSAVSTFENAYGIAARIQACLDDFSPGVWEVKVYENLDEDFVKKISEAADFSIDGGTCLEACDRMYDTWGIGWTHYKDSASGKDVLLFGRPNTQDSGNTSAEFVFGPGQGLTAIKRSVANSDEMGTRLRVFGSSRNMLPGYYRDLDIYNAESVDIQNLMIPPSKWGKTDGKPDARKAYLQASDEVVEQLGLIPRTHYFDGSDGEEIFPSLEGVTIGDIRAAKEEMQDEDYVPSASIYPSDSERADEIKAVTNPEDDGYSGGSDGSKYKDTQTVSFAGVNRQQVLVSSNVRPEKYDDPVTLSWNIFLGVALKADRAVTIEPGMEGYIEDPNKIIEPYEKQLAGRLILSSGSGDSSNSAYADITFDKDGTYYRFSLPAVTLENPADYTEMSLRLELSVKATRSANTYFYVTLSGWDFLLGESTPVKDGFTLSLKQIGFDISQRASFTSDGLARVYMKDGMNAGRSFYVKTCSFDSTGDQWLLGMYRTEDESTGMRYPNSQYPVKPGDHFVLLDIAMPELYIGIAQQRLYDKGLEMLGDISRVKPYYEPEVDAIVMAEQSRTLREGMYMRLSDADVSGASSEYVLIDTLTISEGDAEIPTYKVGLREYKRKTFQETTSAAIDNISQKVSGAGSGGNPTSAPQNYGALSGKPSIDGVTLAGAMRSYDDIGLLNKTHFDVVNVGTEESPIWALRTKYGIVSESFISARGSDPGADGGASGVDMDTVWAALAAGTSELINVSHIPELSISKITGLQSALNAKLEGITKPMVEAVLTGTVTSHNHDGRYAPLSGGLIPSQYLPSYVDDVLEYASMTAFPATGEAGKIYVALDTNLTYRWGGSSYVEISPSLALGHTSSTAYPGDEGAANASAIRALQGLFTDGAANRVAHALTFSYSGGDSETYDGSSAVTVTVPTAEQISAWNLVASLFGVDENGDVKVKDGRGLWSESFISSRGSDPEAGGGAGQGIDEDAMWTILGTPGTEKIDSSHIPELDISAITGLQSALDAKLEGITSQMVVAALGYTPYDAAAISAASVAYATSSGTAGKVSQKLTVKNDGGSSSASAKTFDGSAAVTVTIPTTLPASDVYAWAKAATKPSYTWGEIGGKPSVFTPAAHTHPLSEISDLHASWDALLKAAPAAFVTRWPAWGEVTGKPSAFTPAAHKHVKADITDFPTFWAWSAITGKPTTLAGYGITDGVNSAKATGGLSAAVNGHVLTIGVATGYAVPTSAQISAWNLVASLFGVDSDGNVFVKGGKGFYGTSFVSARGSDPEAGSSGSGLDEDAMWDALAASGSEVIDPSHIPALSQLRGTLTNAQLVNNSISVAGVKVALGGSVSTAQIASALTAAGYKLTDTIYTLPKATVSALGGIKAAGVRTSAITTTQGGTTSGRYYGVELDSNGKAFVNVPWVNTTYSLSSFGITATAAEINKLDGLATTATELGYVHGVTSNIQTQLNAKQATITGAATSIVSSNLTANRALVSSSGGKVAVSAVSATELGYLDGVTSNIQTQLNSKAAVSALSAYLPLSGGTMTGNLTVPALTYSRKYQTRCDSVGWYRCFSFTANNAVYPTAILHISRIFNTSPGESYVFALSVGYDGKVTVTQLSGTAGERIITKIRVAYVNLSTAYVDFYYSRLYSRGNEVYVSSSGIGISQAPAAVNDTTSSFYEFETTDGCKSDTYVTAGQYVYSPKGLFGLTEAQAHSYAGSGSYKLAVGQQFPSKGASLLLYRDSTSYQSYIVWSTGSADHVGIGIKNGTNDLDITNKKGAIKLAGQGILTYNNYTVWHAGNDGSGSGLDADLLDGTQKSGLLTSAASTAATNLSVTVGGTTKSVADLYATYLGGFPATDFDLSTNLGTCQDYGCYVIGLMQITDYTTAGNHSNGELILIRQNGNNPPQKIIYSLSTMYNTENVRFGHLVVGYYSNRATPCTFTHNGKKWAGFNVTTASSYTQGVVCKRDGLRLGERSTPFLLMYKNSSTGEVLDSEVNGSLSVDGGDITNDGVSTTRFVGALEGNATSATKLATARTLWGQPFDGTGNVSGDMTGVGNISMSGGINSRVYVGSGDDLSRIGFKSHNVELKGHGYLNMNYYFRPGYSSSGKTSAAVYIQNASASNSPVFTTTHAFENNGNAAHTGSLTAGSSITTGGHLFMNAATGRFVFNSSGSGFMMSMESGNFRLMSHNNASYVARLAEVDMSGNVGIKAAPASGYALTVAGAGYYSGLLTASGGLTTPQYVQVGDARLKWDASANALYAEKSDGTPCGFYVKGFLSARGSDLEAAAGSGLDEDAMWELLAASGTEKIDESHLPTATASTPGIVKGGYTYKVPGSQTSVNLPVSINSTGQMYVTVPASAIKTILQNLA